MATFVSWVSFDQDEFDFYDLVEYAHDQGFVDNLNSMETFAKNGITYEFFAKDSFYMQTKSADSIYSTAFTSEADITYDGESLSSLSGSIDTFGTVNLDSGIGLYGISGVNVELGDLIDAVLTPSRSDDFSILSKMLNGNDTFDLSDEADLARGLNGADTMYGYAGNDKLYGGNNNDKLYGGNGNDKSYGQAGNDHLYMDAGNDTLDGGSGTDWLYVTGSANSVVNLAKTTGQNTGYGTDIIKNIENASGGTGVDKFYGTAGNNTLKGNNGNDLLYGQNGNDKLYGGSGADKVYGQAGNDSLYMDAGNDTLDGGSGTDWLYVTGSANSVVNLAKTTGQNTGYGTDIIKNIENASGGTGVDKFYGTGGNNTLKGNNGNDVLSGKNGNDTIYGGNNNDKLFGGNNNDKLYGGSGNDLLKGDAGNDLLQGDAGKDTLFGGAGADTFVFRSTTHSSASASGADIIRDFTRGVDKIDLHFIDASTKLSGNNAFTFDGTTSFGTSNQGDIYYKQFNNAGTSNDYTMVYIDTDSDRGTEMSIKLMGLHNLTADDFIL